jgi:hypothetical protein
MSALSFGKMKDVICICPPISLGVFVVDC